MSHQEIFEVLVETDKHWTIRFQTDSEIEAFEQAHNLLKHDKKIDGVKIIHEAPSGDGDRTVSKTIFEQAKEQAADGTPKDLSHQPQTADICQTTNDVTKLSARETLNRMFREYLDYKLVTPSEILHSYDHLKDLENAGNLIRLAIGSLAQAQSKQHGGNITERREQLDILRNSIRRQIIEVENNKDYNQTIKRGGLADYVATLEAAAHLSPEMKDAFLDTSITRSIRHGMGWSGKLEVLLSLPPLEQPLSGMACRSLDRFISDILSGSQAVKEIMGGQATLGDALLTMTTLAAGTLEKKPHFPTHLMTLNKAFADYPLVAAQRVLHQRITQELLSAKALTKDTSDKEVEMLNKIIAAQSEEMVLHKAVQVALGKRSREQIPAEIQRILGISPDPIQRTERLIQLKDRAYGEAGMSLIMRYINDMLSNPDSLTRSLESTPNVTEQLRRMSAMYADIKSLEAYESEKEIALNAIDDFCLTLLRENRIVQKAEQQANTTSGKVDRLLILISSGIIPGGKCFMAIQQRIIGHTKQPGFLQEYTKGAKTPAEAKERMTDLKLRLKNARVV